MRNGQCVFPTQLDFQLRTIAEALQHTLKQTGKARDESAGAPQYEIKKTQHAILLNVRQDRPVGLNRKIEFRPLFSGSFSQSEVAVRVQDNTLENLGQNIKSFKNETIQARKLPLAVISPSLHFARFRPLPFRLTRNGRTNKQPITIVLPHCGASLSCAVNRIGTNLQNRLAENQANTDVVVVSLMQNGIAARKKRAREFRRLLAAKINGPQQEIRHINIRSAADAITLFAASSVVFVPNLGLAADVLNAGSEYCLYMDFDLPTHEQNHNAVADREMIFHSAQLACSDLHSLCQRQIQLIAPQYLVTTTSDLLSVINEILRCFGVPEFLAPETSIPDGCLPVIPLHSPKLRSLFRGGGTVRAKFRKLRQSPKQFFQDSSSTHLQRFSRLVG